MRLQFNINIIVWYIHTLVRVFATDNLTRSVCVYMYISLGMFTH